MLLLAFLLGLDIRTTTGSQGFQASGTYTASSVQTAQYGTGYVNNSSTTIPLYAYYRYPVGLNPRIAVPLVVVLSGGGFDNTFIDPANSYLHLDYWQTLVTAGAVVIAPDYRTCDDTPWNAADVTGDTLKKKAVRGAFQDQRKAFEWVLQYAQRNTANFTIDPRRIFVVGWSAGGQSAIRLAIDRSDKIVGVVGYTCEFGLNTSFYAPSSSDDHTRDIRAFVTEAEITLSSAPIQVYLTDNDGICPVAGALRDRLVTLSARHPTPVVVHSTAPEVAYHDGPAQFQNQETVRQWFNSLMTGIPSQIPNKVEF